ncbi:sodium-dependent glucose transporter 1-like, partial [Mizuhopecten yessoensis]|uniref:sodium-dependent glucose transporter 1-like n=1 Tax=Mizuhopecten yessoensis TaxID=6573 RepID=UPI000B45B723
PRTTNHLEAWHEKLQKKVHHAHPNIFAIIRVFQEIQEANEINRIQRDAGGVNRPRKKRYRNISSRQTQLKEHRENQTMDLMESPVVVGMEKERESFISTRTVDIRHSSPYQESGEQEKADNWCRGHQRLFRKLQKNRKFRAKFSYSIVQCFSYMLLGWMKAQIGPSFSDILRITNASLDEGGILRTIYYAGVVIGCLACAILFSRLPIPLLSAAIFAVASVDIAVIPWCSEYGVMATTHFIQGFCFGIYDTITFAEGVRIWRNNSKSYLQVLAFGFSLASVLSPLASAPFLTEKYTPLYLTNTIQANTSYVLSDMNASLNSQSVLENNTSLIQPGSSNFYIAYTITAILTFLAFVSLLTIWIVYRENFQSIYTNQSEVIETSNTDKAEQNIVKMKRPLGAKRKLFNLILMSLLFAVYNSVDYTFGDFLTIFCVRQLHWTTRKGAFLTSIVFFASVLSRFTAIFIVRICRLDVYLGILFSILICSFIGMAFTARMMWSPGMWACSALVGVAAGPIPGAFVSWTHECFVPITGKVASALFVAAFIGATINPPILSHLLAETSEWFTYLFVIESVMTILIFSIAFILSRKSKQGVNN